MTSGEATVPKQKNVLKEFEKKDRRRKLRQVKKKIRPNRDVRQPRQKKAPVYAAIEDDWDEFESRERIMPRGERERRRSVEALMYTDDKELEPGEQVGVPGRQGLVTQVSTGLCRVSVDDENVLCSLRGSLSAAETGFTNVVTVGDRVVFSQNGDDQGVVEQVLPRRNQITRPDPFYSHLQQALVANLDQLLIVASWREPHLWPELIDRYLIAAERSGVEAIICLNKIDLAESLDPVEQALQAYRAMDIQILLTSAEWKTGLEELRQSLQDKVTVLAGLSGVGKSTLLTAVQPDLQLRIGAVSEDSRMGRHTTTQAVMLSLDTGSYVIDTPGIRQFGIAGLHQDELIDYYPDLLRYAHNCRFSDCSRQHEPGCAVLKAVAAGKLCSDRLKSFHKIRCGLSEGSQNEH